MNTNYSYEEKAVAFPQPSFSIAETPDLKTPSVHIFGTKDASGQSQLLTIDLKTRSPTQTLKIQKGYGPGVLYNPPTETLLQAQPGALLVHKLGINQVVKIKYEQDGEETKVPSLSKVVGELALLLKESTLILVNIKTLNFSRLDIGESGYECIDFVHTGGNTIGVLVRSKSNINEGAVKIFDIIKKELLKVFKLELKSQGSAEKLKPSIFYHYGLKQIIVYRGEEVQAQERLVGVSTINPETLEAKSSAFKIAVQNLEGSKLVQYCSTNNSLYLAMEGGTVFQIGLGNGGYVGGLGDFKGLEAICTHPLWDGVFLVFRPEKEILKMGFVVREAGK